VTPSAFAQWASSEAGTGKTLKRSGSSSSNNPPIATHPTPANASPSPVSAKGSA
jgi:hypothetical protein